LQKGYPFWVTSGCKTALAAAVVLVSLSGGSRATNLALLPNAEEGHHALRCPRPSLPARDDGPGCVWDMVWQWPGCPVSGWDAGGGASDGGKRLGWVTGT